MYASSALPSTSFIPRLARIAAAAFGDLPLRGCMGLGDPQWPPAWFGQPLPAGHTAVMEPNGDISMYIDGQWDSSFPHPGSGSYSDVVTDPRDAFYGKTEGDRAAYFAAAGYDVAPTAGSMGTVSADGTHSMSATDRAAAAAKNTADLQASAATDPFVQKMLDDLHAGIHQGVNDPATLAANARARAADQARWDAYNAAMREWYATHAPGVPFPGLITGTTPDAPPEVTNADATVYGHAGMTPPAPLAIVDVAQLPASPEPIATADPVPPVSGFLAFLKTPLGIAVAGASIMVGAHALKSRRRRRSRGRR